MNRIWRTVVPWTPGSHSIPMPLRMTPLAVVIEHGELVIHSLGGPTIGAMRERSIFVASVGDAHEIGGMFHVGHVKRDNGSVLHVFC